MKIKAGKKVYPYIGEGEDAPKVEIETDDKGRKFYKIDGVRVYTQEHMNFEIGEARKKASEANKTLIAQLEELQQRTTTSEAMKAELEEQIKGLKSASMTKEEQMIEQIKTLEANLNKVQSTLGQERDLAMARWQEERIKNEMQIAAAEQGVYSFEQVYGLLRSKSELKPVLDGDGKPTDRHEVVVTLDVADDKGKLTQRQLPPMKALEAMKGMKDRYGNLFKNQDASGLGGGNSPNNQVVSDTPPPEALRSQEAFLAWKAAKTAKGSSQ